jgi:hypothetical protein
MVFVQLAFERLSDVDLIAEVKRLAGRERQATAQLIASLCELDARRLYLGEGCSSLFTYCTQVLHLSEHAAYGRIEAARAVRRFPVLLERLADGSLTLTSVCLLAPHLTTENCAHVLDTARSKSKREVEQLVAALHPLPPVPTVVRKHTALSSSRQTLSAAFAEAPGSLALATGAAVVERPVASPPAIVKPLAPERYKVQFTIGADTHAKLRRVQDLLRHQFPTGDPALIFDRALTLLVEELERKTLAHTCRPRAARVSASASRHIPAAVKRAVWARDGEQCAFVGTHGRCAERGFLEFHHVVPYAAGGKATVENIQLRCRRHNGYEAELEFGPAIARAR